MAGHNAAAKSPYSSGMRAILPLLLFVVLGGCVVRTATHVAMVPVHAAGWTADKLTTSQAEADRNRGRRDRKAERKARAEQRKAEREAHAQGAQ